MGCPHKSPHRSQHQTENRANPNPPSEPHMTKLTIAVGPELFRFTSMEDWIQHARERFQEYGAFSYTTICVDSQGRVCTCGKHFEIAQETGAYPIRVFDLEPEVPSV